MASRFKFFRAQKIFARSLNRSIRQPRRRQVAMSPSPARVLVQIPASFTLRRVLILFANRQLQSVFQLGLLCQPYAATRGAIFKSLRKCHRMLQRGSTMSWLKIRVIFKVLVRHLSRLFWAAPIRDYVLSSLTMARRPWHRAAITFLWR